MLGLKLNHVSKRGHRCHPERLPYIIRMTKGNLNPMSSRWLNSWRYFIWMINGHCSVSPGWYNAIWHIYHLSDLIHGGISPRWLATNAVCHPDDLRCCCPVSSGWHNVIWVSHADDLVEALFYPDEFWQIRIYVSTLMSSEWNIRFHKFSQLASGYTGIPLIGHLGTNFSKILIEIHTFQSRKCFWKCRLENGGHFVFTSISWMDWPTKSWHVMASVQPHYVNHNNSVRFDIKLW